MYTAKLLWFDLKQAMCCSWQDKFHLKSTFVNKNPLEFHILIIFIHPPLSHTNTHTLAKGWHDKTWLERISLPLLCKYMQITIFDCIFKLIKQQRFFCHVYSNWSLHRLFSSAQTCLATYIRGNTVLLDFEFGKS